MKKLERTEVVWWSHDWWDYTEWSSRQTARKWH